MLLRSFEAHGFKSFADKIEMEFGQGITAIVGPNGSGKSNISDAIRWVLGEQSIRSLRGAKTEDVIFAGSSHRRPLGVAEVLLKFDNSDGALPLDFSEVTISRRVFRSGESEYFINKSPCRLKDIHELFSGTGLGRDSMAVIGQNKVDDVLNNKAEERRLLFEEAAGISKYKQRKREALRKLEDTDQNLTRVLDITSELETQLEPLKESAARTRQYNQLYQELTANQVTLLLTKLAKAEKMVESAHLEQTALTDEDVALSTRLSVAETEREKSTQQLANIDENLLAAEQLINTYVTELERIEGKFALLNERILQSKTSEERFITEIHQHTQKSNDLREKIAAISLALCEKKSKQQEYNQFLEGKSQEYQKTSTSVQRLEMLLDEGQKKTFGHLQDIVDERNNLRTLERDIATLEARMRRLEQEYADYQDQIEASKQRSTLITAAQNSLVQALQQCGEKTAGLHKRKGEIEQDLTLSLNEEKKITNKINELSSRIKILSGMQQEYEGFGRGIKNILKSNAPWRTKICGAVAEILHVPDKYVIAVEIALGGALQHIITEDDETAKKAIHYLKTQNLGRVTFLPLNTIKPRMPHSHEIEAAKTQGALGFAADLVECEPDYRRAIEFLLGRTIVAENIDAALQIAKKAAFGVKIVTLEGELINPGGSLTGGSMQRRETSFLGRNNEIQLNQTLISDTKRKAEGVTNTVFKLKAEMEQINQALENVQQEKQAAEVRRAEFAGQAERVLADINRISFAMKTIKDELVLSGEERTKLELLHSNSKNKIGDLENLDVEHKNQVTNWQEELKNQQLLKETLNDEITTIKINVTAVAQEVNANLQSCQQYEEEKAIIDGQVLQLNQELQNVKLQGIAAITEIDTVTNLRTETQKMKADAEQRRDSAYKDKMTTLSSVQVLDKEIKDLRRRGHEVQNKLHEMQLLLTKYSYEVTNCHEQLRDYFAISIEKAKKMHRDGTVEQLTQAAEKLEQEIALLGPINPAAIDEYDRVLERYNFLKQQFDDLISAKNYLSDIVKDIDNTMSKQFKVAFEQINDYFCDIFARLFGGGKAQLILLEPQDMLNTGIDIVVQPPGKKQQNLMLLSGGERALTVIALLFAFLTYRPAPFCMVDEIDAPLDEANLQRFSQFLRDYSQKTQFIVVTHRKTTMEAADVMHGVTMEESGISKLVSVKFVDKAG